MSAVAELPPGRRAAAAHQRALRNAPDSRATGREAAPVKTLLSSHFTRKPEPCLGDQTAPRQTPPRSSGLTLSYPTLVLVHVPVIGVILSPCGIFICAEDRVHLSY